MMKLIAYSVARLFRPRLEQFGKLRAAKELRVHRAGLRLGGQDWRAWRDEGRR